MILAALLLSVLLTEGCLLEIHPPTEEEQNIIAEYAADVLLRHDENHVGAALLSPTQPQLLSRRRNQRLFHLSRQLQILLEIKGMVRAAKRKTIR